MPSLVSLFAYQFTDAINASRESAMSSVFSVYRDCWKRYQASKVQCSLNCDTQILGCLTKGLVQMDILEPPYTGMNLRRSTETMLSIPITSLCAINRPESRSAYSKTVKIKFESTIKSLKHNHQGLCLGEFERDSKNVTPKISDKILKDVSGKKRKRKDE